MVGKIYVQRNGVKSRYDLWFAPVSNVSVIRLLRRKVWTPLIYVIIGISI
jgi:hypothetical protein